MSDYKPIIPSSLLSLAGDELSAYKQNYNDFTLKSGIVIKTYEVDDDALEAINGPIKSVRYDVLAISQNQDLGTSSVVYKKCRALQSFGGIGDFFEYKLRQPEKDVKVVEDPQDQNGSIVLMMCLNGVQDTAVIIGALSHPKRQTTLTKEAGQHLEGEYNGVNWQINDDGELTVTFKSATDNNGKPENEEAGGSFFKMDKDGSFELNSGEGSEQIRIDKSEKNISFKSGNNISSEAETDISKKAGANISMDAGADWIISAQGKAAITAGSQFDLKADSKISIQGASIEAKADSMIQFKGSMISLDGQTVFVGGQGGTPALVLSTQFLGTGNLGGPVISQAIGPFSSKVFIAT